MAGFFRKVAGAFVEFPAAPAGIPSDKETGEDITALLEQLGGEHADNDLTPVSSPARSKRPAEAQGDALTIGPDQVFEQAGIADGPNSAVRLMKILGGLATFPPVQQLAMVRAIDAADSSWDESSVLADARERQGALHAHLDGIEREHTRRLALLSSQAQEAQAHGDRVLADIDRQLAELQALRHEALTETAQAVAGLDMERREVDTSRQRARTAVADVSGKLSELIGFFAGQRSSASEPHGA